MQASDFTLMQVQASIFTPGLTVPPVRLLGPLLQRYVEDFNGQPMLLPIPENFAGAADVPRMILQNNNGTLRLQAASSRLDLFQAGENAEAMRPLPAFLDWCNGVFDVYQEASRAQVCRVGCVVTRRTTVSDPAREIASHFCKTDMLTGPLNRPSDFEVHAAKQYELYAGQRINSWFRCKSAVLFVAATRQAAVIVEQDLNTILAEPPDSREISRDERRHFYTAVPDGMQETLSLYFP